MLEFHPQLRHVHMGLALLSGALFALRGAGLLAGAGWPRAAVVRWFGHAVDTALLTAALMLVAILPHALFANGWLAAKLALVVAYIGLGMFALGRARGPRARLLGYLAALAVFACVYGVARAHHPLGMVTWWAG